MLPRWIFIKLYRKGNEGNVYKKILVTITACVEHVKSMDQSLRFGPEGKKKRKNFNVFIFFGH